MSINIGTLTAIFLINVTYVTVNTLRVMLTMKGYRVYASLLAVIDTFIYVVGLGIVMDNLDNPINVLIYAVGFGLGIYVGLLIEDQLALGYSVVQAIIPETSSLALIKDLRDKGFGVTVSEGRGRDGLRLKLEILTPRKYERELYRLIHDIEPAAFVITYEPKYVNGGFWSKRVRKSKIEKTLNELDEEE